MTPRFLPLTPIIIFLTVLSYAQDSGRIASVMFYNVENLFDTEDDPAISDEEFLPKGDRRWSHYRFNAKLCSLAKVIVNTGSWEPPAFIGLCEVENRYVLERLVAEPSLRKWNYRIIHKNSPDARGIDVAAIYREDVFKPLSYTYFSPVSENDPIPSTREILYVKGVMSGLDTIHLFVNHWPSRYGGLMETRGPRQKAAMRLRTEVDKLQDAWGGQGIIIMGDFNDQPDDESLTGYLRASLVPGQESDTLYNLSYAWQKEGKGTLKHQAVWSVFDQIVVSGSLLGGRSLYALSHDAVILEASFLFQKDERYLGRKLFRTYEGFRYTGGYSDHLPILLYFRKRD